MPGRQHPEVAPLRKQAIVLLLCACALAPAMAAGIPALAQTSQAAPETTPSTPTGGIGLAVFPQAEAASARMQRAYRRWRRKLDHYDVWLGRNLVLAARHDQRSATAVELRRSIRTMKTRFRRFLRSEEGRAVVFRHKVRKIPSSGRQQLASIASCESHGNPRAVGGGGIYRGMYQFSFSTWQVVGGSGDPAAASRHEQTWRAWLLLSRHGAGHWPVCG
jgi:Transglycosylase-like domain